MILFAVVFLLATLAGCVSRTDILGPDSEVPGVGQPAVWTFTQCRAIRACREITRRFGGRPSQPSGRLPVRGVAAGLSTEDGRSHELSADGPNLPPCGTRSRFAVAEDILDRFSLSATTANPTRAFCNGSATT